MRRKPFHLARGRKKQLSLFGSFVYVLSQLLRNPTRTTFFGFGERNHRIRLIMLISSPKSFFWLEYKSSHHILPTSSKRLAIIYARKKDFSQDSETETKPTIHLKASNKILAQSAIAVLGLGFVDAGYSGDWSRIGVISKEIEDVLKIAAFIVVPLCLFLILSISKKTETS